MVFIKIDYNNWKRKPYFEHYSKNVPCTYSMTTKIDITRLIQSGRHLYSALLFFITKEVNRHEEFRICYNKDGILGYYDQMIPCYTIFNKQTETFTTVWTESADDYNDFFAEYKKDVELYGKDAKLAGKPDMPENVFNVSMIPWISFDGFNLNLQKGYDYFLPIFTFGKYYQEQNKYLLPLSVQVHHAVCDGFHLSRFINEFQDMLAR